MPATLTSVADPTLAETVTHHRYPQRSRVRDVTTRMWDGQAKPEVHRGPTDYVRWTWTPIWPYRLRGEAEALLAFLEALDEMGDASFVLEMPAPVGSSAGPWLHTVECVSAEIVEDLASAPSATQITLELVEVES